ncbi:MAG: hypothetical protein RIE74_02380, partial [Pseudomonadales bacterium]
QRDAGFIAGGFDAEYQHGAMLTCAGLLQSHRIASRIRRLWRPRAGPAGRLARIFQVQMAQTPVILGRRCQA